MNKQKREEMKRHIDRAFASLDKIPVTGASVDFMAIARQELRAVFDILKKDEPEKE